VKKKQVKQGAKKYEGYYSTRNCFYRFGKSYIYTIHNSHLFMLGVTIY
jgi:hypothetical protein